VSTSKSSLGSQRSKPEIGSRYDLPSAAAPAKAAYRLHETIWTDKGIRSNDQVVDVSWRITRVEDYAGARRERLGISVKSAEKPLAAKPPAEKPLVQPAEWPGAAQKKEPVKRVKGQWVSVSRLLPFLRDEIAWAKRDELFVEFDRNKNGVLTLREAQDGILSRLEELPAEQRGTDPRLVIRQAFNAACDIAPHGRPGMIERAEFRLLLANIRYYLEIFDWFQDVDEASDDDEKITEEEFLQMTPYLGQLGAQIQDGKRAWREIDRDGSGTVDFVEFLDWCLRHKLDDTTDDDSDYFRRAHTQAELKSRARASPA